MSPITPQPTTTSPQGVASVAPIAPPTPTAVPQAPTPPATPAPVATPQFNTQGTMDTIANYYQIPRETAAISGAGQAQGQVAQQQFEAQKYQNQIDIKNKQEALDPSKYQFQKNPDGSVTILNSTGDKVDIGTYASLTGENPAAALQKAGATDAKSVQFEQAYNNLQDFIQNKIAAAHGDVQAQAKLDDYYNANKGPNGAPSPLQNMELGQLQQAFMEQYGNFFGQTSSPSKYNQLGSAAYVTPTIATQNNPSTLSPYQNQNFGANFQANAYQPQGTGYGSAAGGPAASLAALQAQLQGQ